MFVFPDVFHRTIRSEVVATYMGRRAGRLEYMCLVLPDCSSAWLSLRTFFVETIKAIFSTSCTNDFSMVVCLLPANSNLAS